MEIEDTIWSLHLNKLSCPDPTYHKLLKRVAKTTSKPLTILSNRSMAECVFP